MKTLMKLFVFFLLLVMVNHSASAQWSLTGNGATTASNFLGTTDAQTLKFRTNNVQRMVIDVNGRLGLGTTAPGYRFDLLTTTDLRGMNLNNSMTTTSTTYGAFITANNTGTGSAYGVYGYGRGAGGSNFGVYGFSNEGAIATGVFGNANTNATTLTAYGVQGTSSGAGTSNYGLFGSATGAGITNYGVYGSASGGTTNWAGYFVNNVYTGGALGLGTTTIADSRLSVQQSGTTVATGKFLNTSKGPNTSWIHFGTSGDWYLRSASNSGKVIIQDQNANATVCIGTTVPATGYKLSVSGKVICTELKVLLQSNWPDYVFAKDYSLMPLKQLEEYISVNSHLPGVPSASEISESDGLAVGEMQTVLLKKLEEANLYILQLHKRVEELEAKVK